MVTTIITSPQLLHPQYQFSIEVLPCHIQAPSLESDEQNDCKVGSELDGRTQVIDDSGHVSKIVHEFYLVKIWPTNPHSISLMKKKESVVEKMNHDICEINERIQEKMSERNHLCFGLECLTSLQREWRYHLTRKGKILNDLYVGLEDLCFVSHAPKRRSNKTCSMGELDNHMLSSLMLHGSKSLAEEKRILRDVNIQKRSGASFKSLDMIKNTVRWNCYLNNWQKLLREVEQFEIQMERASGNSSMKGKIPNSESLRKAIKEEIKHLCDDCLENRRKLIAHGKQVINAQKKLKAIDQVIYSLETKLAEARQKKGEAYQSISNLKTFYDGEVINYYQYCSLISKVHQLAKEKDISALDELSRSEVGKFMLEWNNNKAFREDYEKKVLQSLERRHLSIDGRRKQDKLCTTMFL